MTNTDGQETRVLNGLKWIFLSMGLVALVAFVLEPDVHAHPQLVLLAGTGLLGALTLRALSGLLGTRTDLE
ncbi:MAG: hypothetical protein KDK70_06220 [Myxococcales bacterium]|nr:hypothetical protein [Myxococcales bacterium]